jgi:hypothetical protein
VLAAWESARHLPRPRAQRERRGLLAPPQANPLVPSAARDLAAGLHVRAELGERPEGGSGRGPSLRSGRGGVKPIAVPSLQH